METNALRIAIALIIFAAFLFIQRKQKRISDSYLERLKMGPKAHMEHLADEAEWRDGEERAPDGDGSPAGAVEDGDARETGPGEQ